jgi:hypothetical protein
MGQNNRQNELWKLIRVQLARLGNNTKDRKERKRILADAQRRSAGLGLATSITQRDAHDKLISKQRKRPR